MTRPGPEPLDDQGRRGRRSGRRGLLRGLLAGATGATVAGVDPTTPAHAAEPETRTVVDGGTP